MTLFVKRLTGTRFLELKTLREDGGPDGGGAEKAGKEEEGR